MVLISLLVAIASQVNLGLLNSDFKVSAGIIIFVTFLFYYEELNPVNTAIISGIAVYLLRLVIYYALNGNIMVVVISYMLEIIFYLFYSVFFVLLVKKDKKDNLGFVFIALIFCDIGGNLIEGLLRYSVLSMTTFFKVIPSLLVASIVRSTVILFVLILLKYYGMLLLKEEHENRYKKLLWFMSQLKTEMYWIEKNMESIEKVMSDSYQLFEKINSNQDREKWANISLSIARDVHEIKKENGLVLRGIKEITENEIVDNGMDFKDIIGILYETMKAESKILGRHIEFEFIVGDNFYTSKHYYLMSILRNLIMNSMDAIEVTKENSKIRTIHEADVEHHIFIVEDNGSGIDEEGLKLIFSPGFSTKINYATGEINRGLGLSIVQYIAEEQLGGKVSVMSKLGIGTRFIVSIPRHSLEEER